MGIDFAKFNKEFPADQVKEQMKAAEENGGGSELPDGEYKVTLDKMELTQSSKGARNLEYRPATTKNNAYLLTAS